jgi:hypothetical protein
MRRRHFLTVTGAAAIAGCAGSGDENENPDAENTSDETEQNQESNNDEETDDEQENAPEQNEGEPDFVVTDISPDNAELGEEITQEFIFENQGNGAGSERIDIYTEINFGQPPEQNDFSEFTVEPSAEPGEQTTLAPFDPVSYTSPSVIFAGIREREVDHRTDIPDSKAPILTDASLVSDWESFGDLEENGIEQVEVGESIEIASQYWYWRDQRLDVFRTVRLFNENRDRVRITTSSDEQLVENVGWAPFQIADVFDTTGLDPGEYTAEILVEDESSGLVSDAFETTFTLIDNETEQ